LKSGSQFRAPAPPDKAATQAEISQLKDMVDNHDPLAMSQIMYWNTGSPAYRWGQILVDEWLKHGTVLGARNLALVNVAIYDATIATWDSKYTYNRPRPSEVDPSLTTVIPNPQSPTYPSEYAATAAAASTVLSYLYPDDAQMLADKATQAGASRLLAGVEYPSDVKAGADIGKKVGDLVVARGKADGSDAVWKGTVPTDPGKWTGTNPNLPLMGTWKTWILSSGSEFRPGPPPAYDSDQEKAELAEVENFKRTPQSNTVAFYWQYADGGSNFFQWTMQLIDRMVGSYHVDNDPPRAARAYALLSAAEDDAFIACWDAKYTYWAMRPFQLDPKFTPLFTTPNHPSYPSAHSCNTSTTLTVMIYLFPYEAPQLKAMIEEAGNARIWAGIHFRSDIVAGYNLGQKIAGKAIEWAKADGADTP
jgi:membrane-associated phospholipid phosphatase